MEPKHITKATVRLAGRGDVAECALGEESHVLEVDHRWEYSSLDACCFYGFASFGILLALPCLVPALVSSCKTCCASSRKMPQAGYNNERDVRAIVGTRTRRVQLRATRWGCTCCCGMYQDCRSQDMLAEMCILVKGTYTVTSGSKNHRNTYHKKNSCLYLIGTVEGARHEESSFQHMVGYSTQEEPDQEKNLLVVRDEINRVLRDSGTVFWDSSKTAIAERVYEVESLEPSSLEGMIPKGHEQTKHWLNMLRAIKLFRDGQTFISEEDAAEAKMKAAKAAEAQKEDVSVAGEKESLSFPQHPASSSSTMAAAPPPPPFQPGSGSFSSPSSSSSSPSPSPSPMEYTDNKK